MTQYIDLLGNRLLFFNPRLLLALGWAQAVIKNPFRQRPAFYLEKSRLSKTSDTLDTEYYHY